MFFPQWKPFCFVIAYQLSQAKGIAKMKLLIHLYNSIKAYPRKMKLIGTAKMARTHKKIWRMVGSSWFMIVQSLS
jgi:hypothetical protein